LTFVSGRQQMDILDVAAPYRCSLLRARIDHKGNKTILAGTYDVSIQMRCRAM
jgi:hypothetical protein